MEYAVARQLTEELKLSMNHLNRAAEIGQENLSGSEKAQIMRPLGEVMMKIMDDLFTYLAHENPDLREMLFPSDQPGDK
jgi:hypothetical protein